MKKSAKRSNLLKSLCVILSLFLILFPTQRIILPENETEKAILNIKSQKGKKTNKYR